MPSASTHEPSATPAAPTATPASTSTIGATSMPVTIGIHALTHGSAIGAYSNTGIDIDNSGDITTGNSASMPSPMASRRRARRCRHRHRQCRRDHRRHRHSRARLRQRRRRLQQCRYRDRQPRRHRLQRHGQCRRDLHHKHWQRQRRLQQHRHRHRQFRRHHLRRHRHCRHDRRRRQRYGSNAGIEIENSGDIASEASGIAAPMWATPSAPTATSASTSRTRATSLGIFNGIFAADLRQRHRLRQQCRHRYRQ